MPRIRTVKPEFFRSPDTAKVEHHVRLFYAALWCWADDFGVGETNFSGLLGFAFPDDDEFYDRELRQFRAISAPDVRRFCADVARAFGVTFYEVRGRYYYAVPTWTKHQKTESRGERRKYPTPDDPDATPDLRIYGRADSAPEDPRKSGAKVALEQGNRGTGEQGNRGTGEQGEQTSSSPAATTAREPHPFDAFWAAYPRKVGKDGARKAWTAATRRAPAETILAAATRMARDPNLPETQYVPHPATWLNRGGWDDQPYPPRNSDQRPTSDDRVRAGLTLAQRLAGQETADPTRLEIAR